MPSGPPPSALDAAPPPVVKPRRWRTALVITVIVLLVLALAAAAIALVVYLGRLDDANARIEQQKQLIEEQKDLLDKKETFGVAMNELLATADKFDGVLMASIIPFESYEGIATHAYLHRWDGPKVAGYTADAEAATEALDAQLAAASIQSSTNLTGSTYETITDQLGGGHVASIVDNTADGLCQADVLACVFSDDPYTVHFDAGDSSLPYMKDWQRTGVAYHEFAHVLQMTNPGPTDTALESFGGDEETMADCFALTYLSGWTLDHRVFINRYEYWDVSIGYGYTCDEPQRQVIRDWYGQLGFQSHQISQ